MFGFPTRTRLLFLDPLMQIGGQHFPPKNVIDRDLEQAISAFAPGAQVVRDKMVHRAIGVVSLHPSPHGKAKTAPGLYPPLSEANPRPLGACQNCRAVHHSADLAGQERSTVTCPTCGADALRVLDAREPRQFYSDGCPTDYTGLFELSGRTTRPTMAVTEDTHQVPVGNAVLNSNPEGEPGEILTFNDYGGRDGFEFVPDPMRILGGAYRGSVESGPASQASVSGKRIALLARRRTDTLRIGVDRWPAQHHASPERIEGRAAWYSLAFSLRLAAAVLLDVEPGELDGGMYVTRQDGVAQAQAFLSDRLENGAGYATYLSKAETFTSLMDTCGGVLRRQWGAHAPNCDTSCAKCLRDYTNLPFHPLLDWRLALDMIQMLGSTDSQGLPFREATGKTSSGHVNPPSRTVWSSCSSNVCQENTPLADFSVRAGRRERAS